MAIINNYIGYDPIITPAKVIELAFTNQNTDTTLISSNLIQMAELAHLKLPLGDDFYLRLKQVLNTPPVGTMTAAETTFYDDWLKPTFAWFVRFEVINEIQMNSTSSGIVSAIPEFSKVVDAKELNVYKQDTYRRGKVMLDAMVKFLDDNATDFPEYNSTTSVDCKTGKISGAVKTHGIIIY